MFRITLTKVFIAFLFFLIAGCASVNPQQAGLILDTKNIQINAQVMFTDKNLQNTLQVITTDAERIANGLLQARVIIQNISQNDSGCQGCWEFRDEKGIPIERTSYEPLFFRRVENKTLQRNSTNDRAASFVLIIKP